jgi:hypothetical protein
MFLLTSGFLLASFLFSSFAAAQVATDTTTTTTTSTTPTTDTTTTTPTTTPTDTTAVPADTTTTTTTTTTPTDTTTTGTTTTTTDVPSTTTEEVPLDKDAVARDQQYYIQYSLFLRYQKYVAYQQYKRYAAVAYKYPWEANNKTLSKIKKSLKSDYKKWKKNKRKYARLEQRAQDYRNFDAMRAEYFATKSHAGLAAYAPFDKPSYESYAAYGAAEYQAGYDRFAALVAAGKVTVPSEAEIDASTLGPIMTVGIYSMLPSDLRDSAFRIRANYNFRVLSKNDNFVAEVPAGVRVAVKYIGDKTFSITREDTGELLGNKTNEVRFVPVAGHQTDTIFDLNRPSSSFDKYRDGIRLRYYDSPAADGDRVWVINALPLEHYVWGMGEITGTGPAEYNNIMTTIYRTYGQWKILWSTRYADQGFKVDATSGSQVYYGYDWEVTHPAIRVAAEGTRGRVITYANEVALTPYSSWTDGKTRTYEDGHWGHNCDTNPSHANSDIYPWLAGTDDASGKHSTLSTCELASRGNHMVGLSANGALNRAKAGQNFVQILTHYYKNIGLDPRY